MHAVTSTSRGPLMVLAIATRVMAIGFFLLLPFFVKGGSTWSRLFLAVAGLFYLFWTINLLLTYCNKKVVASKDGVALPNVRGCELST